MFSRISAHTRRSGLTLQRRLYSGKEAEIDINESIAKSEAELVKLLKDKKEPYFGAPSPIRGWTGPAYDLRAEDLEIYTNKIRLSDAELQKLANEHPSILPYLLKYKADVENVCADARPPIRVAVTGAAGQIGYALVFRLASGNVFGPRTPVSLQLLELPGAQEAAKGVEMELRDCAFPTLANIVVTSDPNVAFEGVDYALLVGGMPRTKGMERADLLLKNADIFSTQGKALNEVAKGKDTRVFVVGNPANTNAMIAAKNCPKIPTENFSAMTKLDHNRGLAQIMEKVNCSMEDITDFAIWGNHSPTQFPSLQHTFIKGKPALQVINDDEWYKTKFIPTVQQRGAAVINARGASSAASAASSLLDGVREFHFGTTKITSAAIESKGEYGIEKGLFFSYPVTVSLDRKFKVVENIEMDAFSQEMLKKTENELKQEREAVRKFLE